MNTQKKLAALIIGLGMMKAAISQDPSFSQFFSSPLNINPALTANINADWRMITNFRDQWIGPASPYSTGTISYDSKILQHKIPNVHQEKNILGVGGMLMYDRAMQGIVNSVYASLNLSYNIKLYEGNYIHRLAAGFGAIYGRRYVDFNRLTWEDQWIGHDGFNTNLPTGESALSNMKGYFSASAGLKYSITSEKTNIDIGVAGFHLNKPKQTFLEDDKQRLATRKVMHANLETFLNEQVVLNVNAIYQYQDRAKYYSFGGALGYYLPDYENLILNAGLWYWSKNAVIPYVGLGYKNFQIGVSYDVTISKLNDATMKPKTFELSFIIRGIKDPSPIIPCPWK
jgi:type IX secretion system PorP/SprF family membrane protein